MSESTERMADFFAPVAYPEVNEDKRIARRAAVEFSQHTMSNASEHPGPTSYDEINHNQ